MISVACIVEGDGERLGAARILVQKIAARLDPSLYVNVPEPVKVKRTRIQEHFNDLQIGIDRAVGLIRPPGGILILFDSEDDCPATLAPDILRRARAHRSDLPLTVVLAKCEYEAWFLAGAESLRGKRGLPSELNPPPDPEVIRDAKGWLRAHMPRNRKYAETTDQAALTHELDFDLARGRSASFDKCCREIEWLLRRLTSEESPPPEAENP